MIRAPVNPALLRRLLDAGWLTRERFDNERLGARE